MYSFVPEPFFFFFFFWWAAKRTRQHAVPSGTSVEDALMLNHRTSHLFSNVMETSRQAVGQKKAKKIS